MNVSTFIPYILTRNSFWFNTLKYYELEEYLQFTGNHISDYKLFKDINQRITYILKEFINFDDAYFYIINPNINLNQLISTQLKISNMRLIWVDIN